AHRRTRGGPRGADGRSDAELARGGRGRERVAHVERAAELEPNGLTRPAELAARRTETEVHRVRHRIAPCGHEGGVEQEAAVGVVDVDHRTPGPASLEEPRLGLEVRLH